MVFLPPGSGYFINPKTNTFSSKEEKGDKFFVHMENELIAFEPGSYPQIEISAPSQLHWNEPVLLSVKMNITQFTPTYVDWYLNGALLSGTTRYGENHTIVFDHGRIWTVVAVLRTVEGSAGMTFIKLEFPEEEEIEEETSIGSIEVIVPIIAVIFIMFFSGRKKLNSPPSPKSQL